MRMMRKMNISILFFVIPKPTYARDGTMKIELQKR